MNMFDQTDKSIYIDHYDQKGLRDGDRKPNGIKSNNSFTYIQSPPILYTAMGHSVQIGDIYQNGSCFLICGGPSFANVNKQLLNKPGVLTMGLNNSVKSFRPNMWCSVDSPSHFMKSIWLDPKIQKFVPYSHISKNIFDNQKWEQTNIKPQNCPNCLFYRRNQQFTPDNFLFQTTVNWGNHGDLGGGRTVMLPAIRLLYYLGIRNIYLLGVDFKMSQQNKYHFQQDRSNDSIRGNNSSYRITTQRFKVLRPIFQKHGLNIYNCNPKSSLKVFDFVKFQKAIQLVTGVMPKDASKERTAGLYQRNANLQKQAQNKAKENKKQSVKKTKDLISLSQQQKNKIQESIKTVI